MRRGRAISALSLAAKLEKSDKVNHNMTEIASVLAVATIFISLWTLISRQRSGVICETKYLCRNLSQSVGGGVIAGFYGTSTTTACYDDPLPDLNRSVQPMDSSYHYPLKWFQG